ncbi:MAG TPA: DoxX family membrane protein [Cyclobacteriaceae bacterium]|nr:DoxX family membrane protein [Cyclobacteriaceae bacterium]
MTTKNLKLFGRIFYGVAIAGIGALHFVYNDRFRGVLSAVNPDPRWAAPILYFFAVYFLISGILIALGKKLRATSAILAWVLLLFILFGHLPVRLTTPQELGAYTNVLKMCAFIGGALFICWDNRSETIPNNFVAGLTRLAPLAKYFFCIMLLVFGIDHFVYVDFVTSLVPKYMPVPIFWTYLTGVALFGAGISILLNIRVRMVAQLLAFMLFVWVFAVHLTLAIKHPEWNAGENITATFQCLAFTGIALTVASLAKSGVEIERSLETTDVVQPKI